MSVGSLDIEVTAGDVINFLERSVPVGCGPILWSSPRFLHNIWDDKCIYTWLKWLSPIQVVKKNLICLSVDRKTPNDFHLLLWTPSFECFTCNGKSWEYPFCWWRFYCCSSSMFYGYTRLTTWRKMKTENEIEFSHLFQECFFRIGKVKRNDTEQNRKRYTWTAKNAKKKRDTMGNENTMEKGRERLINWGLISQSVSHPI